jgi:hypothetical protein
MRCCTQVIAAGGANAGDPPPLAEEDEHPEAKDEPENERSGQTEHRASPTEHLLSRLLMYRRDCHAKQQ